ncbi:MAG: FAD-dependent oxidoreductase [Planctomycetes bacterium]|nr:FAD-dependent oxidoreductase [Planctomycetota bacterium]
MRANDQTFPTSTHETDLCVVGGGMAGILAALAAARHGAKVVLMHDRPVLGGNASSECRVHVCGADRHNGIPNMRETGILEEIRMENLYRNPNRNFSIWDTILYEKVMFEPNATLLLNCSCQDAEMDGSRIAGVAGWQLTTQTHHVVNAKIFADCSGDSILAPLTGAEFRAGREARSEYGESIAPEEADKRTMGMSCLFHTREYDSPQPFTAPDWAETFDTCDELPYGADGHRWWHMGYWWVELGGEHDSIHDSERLRDELLKIAYGVWDHIKNRCPRNGQAAENWALDWIQFLPGRRESRRYIGDHVLTQLDIEAVGHFDDVVAYGGWTMDDHHPAGFRAAKLGHPATIFHHAPSPYGIPYRCLYSRNVQNLMFAGRNISATHAAISSTRVMGTCCSMAQAAGTAAAMALSSGLAPRDITRHVDELQQTLIDDDCYLPWIVQKHSGLTLNARLEASQGDAEPLRDGINRPVADDPHCWPCSPGDSVAYLFDGSKRIDDVTVIVDSALDKLVALSYHQKNDALTHPPDVMPKEFRIETLSGAEWQPLHQVSNNRRRHVRLPVGQEVHGIRYVLDETWGSERSRLYAFYVR